MRKRNPTLFLALSCLLLPGAESFAAISFGIGPKVGVNFADASVSNHKDTDHRTGLALGATAEFGVTRPWSLMVEPLYVQRGTRFNVPFSPQVEANLDYLEFPVLVKAKFGQTAKHVYAFAGPSLGINVSAEGSFGSASNSFKDNASAVTWSGEAGAGGAFQIRPYTYLQADLRYTLGFNDALNKTIGDIDSWGARDIRLMVGVLFHLTQ
jgi:hypothetical protein